MRHLNFFDFTDDLFYSFTNEYLQSLVKINPHDDQDTVGRTHIRAIQQRTLHFLLWLSKKFYFLTSQPLVGVEGQGARVNILLTINKKTGRKELVHRDLITGEPDKNDKGAITEVTISKIQDAIFHLFNSSESKSPSNKTKSRQDLLSAEHKYLYERRMFVIRMMKLTGQRPEELIDIPLDLNTEVEKKLFIRIPTKKQGYPAPLRNFRISLRAALDFNRYIEERRKFCSVLYEQGICLYFPKNILLSANGMEFKKESLTKEFSRICATAQLGNLRTCLSMFRHRFISREMHTLILERFKQSTLTPTKEEIRDDICFITMRKTGHKRVESLYTYFDEEYQLITGSPNYEKVSKNRERLDSASEALTDLKFKNSMDHLSNFDDKIAQIEAIIDQLYQELLC
jgi:hypothetical protein